MNQRELFDHLAAIANAMDRACEYNNGIDGSEDHPHGQHIEAFDLPDGRHMVVVCSPPGFRVDGLGLKIERDGRLN